jgi:hypothetical protein
MVAGVHVYPDVPSQRARAVVRDAIALLALVLLAWLGLAVHDAVDELAVLGEGVGGAGTAVQGGFEAVAERVEGTPLVGGSLADGLREAGEGTGGNVADLGAQGESAVHDLATLLGAIVFGVPAVLVLWLWLPARIDQIRRMRTASGVLAFPTSPERERLLAMRAAFALPYGRLLTYTPDPLGDLAAGRYEALVRAAYEDAGLVAPPPATSHGT